MEQSTTVAKTGNTVKYSIVCISGSYFGIDVSAVSEVVPLPVYTKLPNVAALIKGIFNLRGQIYSIIDTRILFNLDGEPMTSQPFVVILRSVKYGFGILVEKVMDVQVIEISKVKPVTDAISKDLASFLSGSVEDKKLGLVHLLDIEALINSDRISRYRFNRY